MCIKFKQNRLLYHRLMAPESGGVFFNHPVCLIGFNWGRSIGVHACGPVLAGAPTLACRRPMGHRRGIGPQAWGPQWTHMDPHLSPVNRTWASTDIAMYPWHNVRKIKDLKIVKVSVCANPPVVSFG